MPPVRKIIHIDMDAFFASVEQRDFPELRGKPVAVGGAGARGVVAAASYEARKFGVFSAMSSKIALRKCPDLIFVKPRFEQYQTVSLQIRQIFSLFTDLIEPLSLDEAYLDVSQNKQNNPSGTLIAREIKRLIWEQTGLRASAGVSFNKFLAKIASDYDKPDGLFVITPQAAPAFLDKLPVEKFHGVGKVTAAKMKQMGLHTGADLKAFSEKELLKRFGKAGIHFYRMAAGMDERPVNPERIRKSVGTESTFQEDLCSPEEIAEALLRIEEKLWNLIAQKQLRGRTLTLKVKFADFRQITRSQSPVPGLATRALFQKTALDLLTKIPSPHKGIRLLGLQLGNLQSNHNLPKYESGAGTQLRLFG